jgi:glucosamine--fructose-6-phosphate aminotransferase (isomerizing)
VAIVHNGIIENWVELKARLESRGHGFASETDTEVAAHLIEELSDVPLAVAVADVLRRCEGALALAVIRRSDPGLVVGGRKGSPLVIGRGTGENFLASDIPAFMGHTRRMMVVPEDRVVEIRSDSVRITDLSGEEQMPQEQEVEWDMEAAEKGGYPTFMIKEIHEQPRAVAETLLGRISPSGQPILEQTGVTARIAKEIDKVFVVACGTSYHAGMMAKYALERWAKVPVEVDLSSEFRYRDPVLDSRSLVIGISQSGETADTLGAVRYARGQGAHVAAVTNVVGSSLAREAQMVLQTRAGPEIGVAASKTFITQVALLQLLGLHMAIERGVMTPGEAVGPVNALRSLPDRLEEVLGLSDRMLELAEEWSDVRDFFFLGRSVDYPAALEGALKLKELSYVRAEGYAAGEMKHGPIALIEPGVVVFGVATDRRLRSKMLSNLSEMSARGGTVITLVGEEDQAEAAITSDLVIPLPEDADLIGAVLAVVPLQLFSYHLATLKGLNVDQPRNLAKTVTVE